MAGTNINETTALARANRIAVQVTPTGFKADFYRTHKKLATLLSDESGWEADQTKNKSALREDFRQFAIEHAGDIGILWQPQDLRSEENKRIPKYETDVLLKVDAEAMLQQDIYQLVAKCPHGVTYLKMEAEMITPVTHSAKGTDLTKLGVIAGRYEKSGNWAWADVEMLITLIKGAEEIYYTTKVQLVSGQLKKPHITQTSFNEAIKTSLQEAGIWQEAEEDKVGLGDEEHEGLHMDFTAEEEARAMAEAEAILAKMGTFLTEEEDEEATEEAEVKEKAKKTSKKRTSKKAKAE